jgi:hypothetical protein
MVRWICPECGGDWRDVERDCPACNGRECAAPAEVEGVAVPAPEWLAALEAECLMELEAGRSAPLEAECVTTAPVVPLEEENVPGADSVAGSAPPLEGKSSALSDVAVATRDVAVAGGSVAEQERESVAALEEESVAAAEPLSTAGSEVEPVDGFEGGTVAAPKPESVFALMEKSVAAAEPLSTAGSEVEPVDRFEWGTVVALEPESVAALMKESVAAAEPSATAAASDTASLAGFEPPSIPNLDSKWVAGLEDQSARALDAESGDATVREDQVELAAAPEAGAFREGKFAAASGAGRSGAEHVAGTEMKPLAVWEPEPEPNASVTGLEDQSAQALDAETGDATVREDQGELAAAPEAGAFREGKFAAASGAGRSGAEHVAGTGMKPLAVWEPEPEPNASVTGLEDQSAQALDAETGDATVREDQVELAAAPEAEARAFEKENSQQLREQGGAGRSMWREPKSNPSLSRHLSPSRTHRSWRVAALPMKKK